MHAHEVIDQLYKEDRNAVNFEIDQVDDLFLLDAAKKGKRANEVELTNFLA